MCVHFKIKSSKFKLGYTVELSFSQKETKSISLREILLLSPTGPVTGVTPQTPLRWGRSLRLLVVTRGTPPGPPGVTFTFTLVSLVY